MKTTVTIPTSLVWLWSIPKVSRPVTRNNEDHWQPATAAEAQTDDVNIA